MPTGSDGTTRCVAMPTMHRRACRSKKARSETITQSIRAMEMNPRGAVRVNQDAHFTHGRLPRPTGHFKAIHAFLGQGNAWHEDEHVVATALHAKIPDLVCRPPMSVWRRHEQRHIGSVVRISVQEMEGKGEAIVAGRQRPKVTRSLDTEHAQPVESIEVRQVTNGGPIHRRHPDGPRRLARHAPSPSNTGLLWRLVRHADRPERAWI